MASGNSEPLIKYGEPVQVNKNFKEKNNKLNSIKIHN